jgi:ankyrin repeat protein
MTVDRRAVLRMIVAAVAGILPLSSRAQAVYEEFMHSVANDFAERVKAYLARGMDPNTVSKEGEPALLIAARAGNSNTVDALLAAPGVKVDARSVVGDTALMAAAIAGKLDIVKKLRARGAVVNMSGWTPLIYAATGGHVEIVRYLLAEGADINAVAPNGNTALIMASREGQMSAAELLIDTGANVNVRNHQGETALEWARRNDDGPLVARLRRAGARD